ncbi:uncharacterized protein BCR38DRAFT_353481 [Pseudomassariella vexata]|uniref:Uncharacterized protein n=1 Tax=Pseudomassariella vexata TaxID=1141098 RepID=A0A1Y2DG05_9PEZI|nr:uncharacterized protein BCR38DRAFT_353481 [Pseudomassariella vexata]ORY58046.1 hypothetical protein BCR38DRAFT_353481 [Pseudomassariella vexata]
MPPPKEHKRIWGLSRETFVAVMAGLAVFVIGLLATVLAVTLGSWGSSSTSSTVSTGVLSDSKLAALNWTDYSGVDHTAVAYQHKSNAIMISTRNSLTGIWTNVNVTESVMNATKSTGLDVLPGTPLAYATNKGLWNLYYLTSDNAVAELYSTNPLTGQWLMGEFGARTGAQAVAGSRLGAVWQSCQNCSNSLLVIWQKENGQVQLANYTNMAWELRDVIAESAPPGTGMAISAFTDSRGTGEFGTDTNSLRAYVADGSNLMENQNGPDTDFTWDLGNSAQPISSGLSVTPCPEVVSITYGENGWDNNLVTYLSADGDLVSNIWRGSAWDVQAPVLAGAPEGVDTFSSIATTQQMRTFALANGVIHEYTTTAANPFTWLWVGKVVTED